MSTRKAACFALLVLFLSTPVFPGFAEETRKLEVNLGTPVSEAQLRARAITIFPDGRNLPPGRGRAREGAVLYLGRCRLCHGETGTEGPASRLAGSDGFLSLRDPLRVLRIQKHPLLVLSVGAQWPYATSIFDYVRRAMPHNAPKSLSHDEVYALTAYILYLNGLVEEQTVVDKQTLPRVQMPGLARSVDLWRGP